MNFEEFGNKITDALNGYFGEGYTVRLVEVPKNNGIVRKGVSICPEGVNISPTIYLEELYERHRMGMDLSGVFNRVISVYEQHKIEENIDVSIFTDFNNVKDRIVYKLISKDSNEEYLRTIPHRDFLDMAVVFYYAVMDDSLGMATVIIGNDIMKGWGINTDDLMNRAVMNTPRIMTADIEDIWDIIKEGNLVEEDLPAGTSYFESMYVMTNSQRLFGAATIIYPGVLEAFSDRVGSGVFVLPSSIHEVILVPEKEGMTAGEFRNIVRDVNRTQVDPLEVLSDSVYYYDRDERRLMVAAS